MVYLLGMNTNDLNQQTTPEEQNHVSEWLPWADARGCFGWTAMGPDEVFPT